MIVYLGSRAGAHSVVRPIVVIDLPVKSPEARTERWSSMIKKNKFDSQYLLMRYRIKILRTPW